MPISKELEALIGLVQDPNRKKALTELVEQEAKLADELKGGILRQSDYDRNLNRLKQEYTKKEEELQQSITKYKTKYDENIAWFKQNEQRLENAKAIESEVASLRDQKTELERKVQQALERKANEGGVDVAELDPKVVEAEVRKVLESTGVLTKEQIDAAVKEQVKAAGEEYRKNFYDIDLPAATRFSMDMSDIIMDHRTEFGEKLNRDEFAKFMRENQLTDPNKAYEQFVAPKREEKKLADAVAKAKAEGAEEAKKQFSTNNVPGADSNAVPGIHVGVMQHRLATQAPGGDGPKLTGASAAAAELRNEGKV